jgi:hypothetical protein
MGGVDRSLVRMPLDFGEGYQQFHAESFCDNAVEQDVISKIRCEDVVDVCRQRKVSQIWAMGLDDREPGKRAEGILKILDGNHVG